VGSSAISPFFKLILRVNTGAEEAATVKGAVRVIFYPTTVASIFCFTNSSGPLSAIQYFIKCF